MIIDLSYLVEKYSIDITGVLHVGAHLCEERDAYKTQGILDSNIIWIEADPNLVCHHENNNLKVYQAVISDNDDEWIDFIMTNNNGESSSMLELDIHTSMYPEVVECHRLRLQTTTIDTFFQHHSEIDKSVINFANIVVQGVELKVLLGMTSLFESQQLKAVYIKVLTKYLYKDCCLLWQIDEFFAKYSFKRVELKMTQLGWGDALYLVQPSTSHTLS